ncbi:MAG: hypothetical protein WA188_10905 [Terriglobales bacterium]
MNTEDERIFLNSVFKLTHQIIEHANDRVKIAEYIDQLNELKSKLVVLEPTKKKAAGLS